MMLSLFSFLAYVQGYAFRNQQQSDTNFAENVDRYDWFSIAHKSPGLTDFKKFLRFKENEIVGNGHQKRDFIVQCNFDNDPCNLTDFKTFQHVSYGNCFTFNAVVDVRGESSNLNGPKFTSKIGSGTGSRSDNCSKILSSKLQKHETCKIKVCHSFH